MCQLNSLHSQFNYPLFKINALKLLTYVMTEKWTKGILYEMITRRYNFLKINIQMGLPFSQA